MVRGEIMARCLGRRSQMPGFSWEAVGAAMPIRPLVKVSMQRPAPDTAPLLDVPLALPTWAVLSYPTVIEHVAFLPAQSLERLAQCPVECYRRGCGAEI